MVFNYLATYWSRRHAYNVHLERMGQAGKKPVSYQAFCLRLRKWWDINKAIYTPSDDKKIPNKYCMKPVKKWWQVLIDYFKEC